VLQERLCLKAGFYFFTVNVVVVSEQFCAYKDVEYLEIHREGLALFLLVKSQ